VVAFYTKEKSATSGQEKLIEVSSKTEKKGGKEKPENSWNR